MNKKDKEKMLKLVAVSALIVVTIFFMFGLGRLPVQVIAVCVLLLHYVVVSPGLCKHLYQIYGQHLGIVRWIPVVNEIEMFSGANYYASMVVSLITVVIFLLRFLPNSVIGSLFGLKAGMFWGYNITAVLIVALVITNFVFGFGFCRLLHDLNIQVMERYSATSGKLETIVYYVMLLIPFIRICPLIAMWIKAVNMARLEPTGEETAFVEKQEDF